MRKIIVPATLAVLVGGYTAYWYHQTTTIRHNLEQAIDAYNTRIAASGSTLTPLRYESITTGGYPFSISFTFNKPVANLPISDMLRKASPSMPTSAEWREEFSAEAVTISYNLPANHSTFSTTGSLTDKSWFNNALVRTIVSSSAQRECHTSIPRGTLVGGTMPDSPAAWLTFPLAVNCHDKDASIKNATGAELYHVDDVLISYSNAPSDGPNRSIGVQVEIAGMKATQAGDADTKLYYSQIDNVVGTLSLNRAMRITPSELGTQNLAFDATYDGPVQADEFSKPTLKLRLDINHLDMSNTLLNGPFELHLATAPEGEKGDSRTASLSIHTHSEMTAHYNELLTQQIELAFAEAENPSEKTSEKLAAAQSIAKFGSPHDIAAALVPDFHSLGTLSLDVDFSGKGPNNMASLMQSGSAELKNLDFKTTPYGITTHGSTSATNGKRTADLVLACVNCDNLITDLGNYALRVESVFDRARPGQPPFVTKDLVEGVRQFIHGLAENPEKTGKDVVIHAELKDTGDFTISGKQLMQIIGLFGSTIAPHISTPAAEPVPMDAPQQPPVTPQP